MPDSPALQNTSGTLYFFAYQKPTQKTVPVPENNAFSNSNPISACLLMAIASAHAFVACLAVAAIAAGFYLNCLQGTVFLVSTVIAAAGNTAADMGIGLFLRHDNSS